jgi:hypothetical protein
MNIPGACHRNCSAVVTEVRALLYSHVSKYPQERTSRRRKDRMDEIFWISFRTLVSYSKFTSEKFRRLNPEK